MPCRVTTTISNWRAERRTLAKRSIGLMSAAACGSIENTVESDPCFRGRFKAILHEPTEALKIHRYIHLNPVRIAALGGHETRGVAAHKITAQLARRRVDALEQMDAMKVIFRKTRRSRRSEERRVGK